MRSRGGASPMMTTLAAGQKPIRCGIRASRAAGELTRTTMPGSGSREGLGLSGVSGVSAGYRHPLWQFVSCCQRRAAGPADRGPQSHLWITFWVTHIYPQAGGGP